MQHLGVLVYLLSQGLSGPDPDLSLRVEVSRPCLIADVRCGVAYEAEELEGDVWQGGRKDHLGVFAGYGIFTLGPQYGSDGSFSLKFNLKAGF